MSSEWSSFKFQELCDITRGASPRPIHDFLGSEGMPWIKIADATAETSRHITKTNEKIKLNGVSSSVKVFPGDLILSNSATPGLPKFLKINACIHDGWMLLRNFKNLDKDFAYWLLLAERKKLVAQGNGSVFTNLKTDILKNHEVKIPSLSMQSQIADTLNTLDDRITLLRETNKTLGAITQAIFKSWFIDFDPVRAKMEGRAPAGLDEETAALFSDELVESELGLVPKGWDVKTVGEAVETVGGATPDTKNQDYWEPAEHHWTSPKDLSGLSDPVLLSTERRISSSGLSKIGSGLLPVGTLLMSSRAPIGYLAIADMPVAINQGYIAIPPGGQLSPLYMLRWCQANMEGIKGRANGSTFMEISKKAFRPIPILLPNPKLLDVFEETCGTLFDRLLLNSKQAQTLCEIRDSLLPRLISGKLQVDAATAETL
jgi:type I restriction enzyme S subunit